MCRESNIVLLTLPPNTSHKLQPLDRSVYGPLKRYLNAAIDDWQRMHPSRAMTIYEMAELSGVAFNRSMTNTNITTGFEATGIISESDFLSADVIECPVQQGDHPAVCYPIPSTSTVVNPIPSTSTAADPIPSTSTAVDPIPSTSTAAGSITPKTTSYVVRIPKASAQQLHTTPEQILPLPKAAPRRKTTKRRKVASAILTTTPKEKQTDRSNSGPRREQTKSMQKKKGCCSHIVIR